MSSGKSLVGKVEEVVDDLNKVHRRKPWLFYLIVAGLVGFAALYVFEKFWGIPGLKKQISVQKEEMNELKRDRDAKASQLAPFLALASKQFPNQTEPERLEKLLQQIEEATVQMKQIGDSLPRPRRIADGNVQTIVMLLSQAPKFSVTISYESSQRDAEGLANQLRSIFEKGGWQVKGPHPAMIISSGSQPAFQISVKEIPPSSVQRVLSELFDSLHLKRAIAKKTDIPANELSIYVGHQ